MLTRSPDMGAGPTGNDLTVQRTHKARVLVADSNAAFAGVVAELLADEPGFTVVAAVSTAREAVRAVLGSDVDVVLVDERLDGSLPSDVLPSLREAAPRAAILLWSHHELHTAAEGVDGVLQRGSTFRELVRAVRTALRERSAA